MLLEAMVVARRRFDVVHELCYRIVLLLGIQLFLWLFMLKKASAPAILA